MPPRTCMKRLEKKIICFCRECGLSISTVEQRKICLKFHRCRFSRKSTCYISPVIICRPAEYQLCLSLGSSLDLLDRFCRRLVPDKFWTATSGKILKNSGISSNDTVAHWFWSKTSVTPALILFLVSGKKLSVLKTHTSLFTDINGQREGHAETNEQGNKHTYVLKANVKANRAIMKRHSTFLSLRIRTALIVHKQPNSSFYRQI